MHREEEIKEGSCDEKRVGDPGCILIQTKGVEDRIEQAADTEERKMFFHSLRVDGVGLWSVGRLVCRVRNKAKAIRLSTLNEICKALGCQPGDLLQYVEDEDSPEAAGK